MKQARAFFIEPRAGKGPFRAMLAGDAELFGRQTGLPFRITKDETIGLVGGLQ